MTTPWPQASSTYSSENESAARFTARGTKRARTCSIASRCSTTPPGRTPGTGCCRRSSSNGSAKQTPKASRRLEAVQCPPFKLLPSLWFGEVFSSCIAGEIDSESAMGELWPFRASSPGAIVPSFCRLETNPTRSFDMPPKRWPPSTGARFRSGGRRSRRLFASFTARGTVRKVLRPCRKLSPMSIPPIGGPVDLPLAVPNAVSNRQTGRNPLSHCASSHKSARYPVSRTNWQTSGRPTSQDRTKIQIISIS